MTASDNFQGRLIHQHRDEEGDIQVIDHGHQRILCFDNGLVQSRKDKFRPNALVHDYLRAMLLAQAFTDAHRATILGLGGGCLARALRALDKELSINAIEIRPAVAEITRDYFGLPGDNRFALFCEDALAFVEQQGIHSTDLILCDLYDAHSEVPLQSDIAFYKNCHRILSEQGWLIVNHHTASHKDSAHIDELTQLFPQMLCCSTSDNNHVLYLGKGMNLPDAATRLRRVKEFQNALKCRLDVIYQKVFDLSNGVYLEHIA